MFPMKQWNTPLGEVLVFRTIHAFKEACMDAGISFKNGDSFEKTNPNVKYNNYDCECCQAVKKYARDNGYDIIVMSRETDNENHFIGLIQRDNNPYISDEGC